MRGELTRDIAIRPSSIALWTGILAGPIAWAAAQELKYALEQFVCWNHALWIFWMITIAGLIVCGVGAFSAWRGAAIDERTPRVVFMMWGGYALSAFFAIVIVAMA